MNNFFSKFKDKHKNKKVFIIGNGPSLKDTNLNLLKDETSIAMNRVSLIYEKNKDWKPTYYLFTSTNVVSKDWSKEWKDSVIKSIKENKTTSFISEQFKEIIDPENQFEKVYWMKNVTEIKPDSNGRVNPNSFSRNIVERIDKSGTSINLALQLAYHMGFSEIIFLGTDLGWTKDLGGKSDPNHFDPNYRADIPNPLKANIQMRNIHKLGYSNFKKYKPNTSFYNASKKTVLDIYPIIDFEQFIINNKIIIRDKDQIIARNFWKNIENKMKVFNLINYFKSFKYKISSKIRNQIFKLKKNKKILTSERDENGFLYVCTGESYARECLLSIKSLKKHNKYKIAVFSEEAHRNLFKNEVDYFFVIKKDIKRPKVNYISQSPFTKSIYLDTDTFIDDDLSDLFTLLDKFDFAGVICHSRKRDKYSKLINEYKSIPYNFSEINSGVLAFKKNHRTSELFKNWQNFYYKYIEQTEGWDQPSLRIALWITSLKQYILPVEYNVRPESVLKKIKSMPSEVLGSKHLKPKIYHAHYSPDVHKNIFEINELDELEKILKEKSLPITY